MAVSTFLRSVAALAAAAALVACNGLSPVAQQAEVDTRHDPVRADVMLSVNFAPSQGDPTPAQVAEIGKLAASGRRAQRDEFVVVSDGSGGALQRHRAQRVSQALSNAGARWVSTQIEPTMKMGPNAVVVVRSEYLIGRFFCPDYNPATIANQNEGAMPGFGCGDAYNMGEMLARPRDAVAGRPAGPADATVNAAAIARYREGRVRALNTSGIVGAPTADNSGGGGGLGNMLGSMYGASGGAGGGTSAPPSGGAPAGPTN